MSRRERETAFTALALALASKGGPRGTAKGRHGKFGTIGTKVRPNWSEFDSQEIREKFGPNSASSAHAQIVRADVFDSATSSADLEINDRIALVTEPI